MSRQERLFIFILSTTLTLIQAALALVFGIALLNVTGSAEKDFGIEGLRRLRRIALDAGAPDAQDLAVAADRLEGIEGSRTA